jgi:hypothetical protein
MDGHRRLLYARISRPSGSRSGSAFVPRTRENWDRREGSGGAFSMEVRLHRESRRERRKRKRPRNVGPGSRIQHVRSEPLTTAGAERVRARTGARRHGVARGVSVWEVTA